MNNTNETIAEIQRLLRNLIRISRQSDRRALPRRYGK